MPVILTRRRGRCGSTRKLRDEGLLGSLLTAAPDDLLELRPASPLVNNANNEGPELLEFVPPRTPTWSRPR